MFDAVVESVEIASPGTEAWVVDFDPRWVVTLRVERVTPALSNAPRETMLQSGETYRFGIHSPAQLFLGHPGPSMVGNRLRFAVHRLRTTRGVAYERLRRLIR